MTETLWSKLVYTSLVEAKVASGPFSLREGESGQDSIHRGAVIEWSLIWFLLVSLLYMFYSWEPDLGVKHLLWGDSALKISEATCIPLHSISPAPPEIPGVWLSCSSSDGKGKVKPESLKISGFMPERIMFMQNELGSQSKKKNNLIENVIHP